ncbi:hypothetical protein V3851_25320 [Paenibacillus sp. M1]|uniref:Resolvase/invertase-type recombinase catalytic domain-containing protein n=1 Tax=Paenibacillus haidiansis TaxID=1574488 RepID=A0ABU7W0P5_9BACL
MGSGVDDRQLTAIYIRVPGGVEPGFAQRKLLELACDLGLGVFDIYVDYAWENEDDCRMLEQLLTDSRNRCFGTVLRMSSTFETADRDFVEHLISMLALEGVQLITLGGQYGVVV